MTTFILYLLTLLIATIKCEIFPSQIRSNISCNKIVSDIFNYSTNTTFNESHYHQFIINSSYNVHFEGNCNDNDINSQFNILDYLGNIISDPYCSNGNQCSNCSINVTIPLNKGKYFVKTTSYQETNYELKINCSLNCDYYAPDNHTISSSHRIFDSVTII
eukprot:277772_1